ncbi:hypothetical protein CULT_1430021 [[Clostridium] ultunense Esp]|nr:hypothetical protein CULT_1430021 [[Clostridium] ultunense Esp]
MVTGGEVLMWRFLTILTLTYTLLIYGKDHFFLPFCIFSFPYPIFGLHSMRS